MKQCCSEDKKAPKPDGDFFDKLKAPIYFGGFGIILRVFRWESKYFPAEMYLYRGR